MRKEEDVPEGQEGVPRTELDHLVWTSRGWPGLGLTPGLDPGFPLLIATPPAPSPSVDAALPRLFSGHSGTAPRASLLPPGPIQWPSN